MKRFPPAAKEFWEFHSFTQTNAPPRALLRGSCAGSSTGARSRPRQRFSGRRSPPSTRRRPASGGQVRIHQRANKESPRGLGALVTQKTHDAAVLVLRLGGCSGRGTRAASPQPYPYRDRFAIDESAVLDARSDESIGIDIGDDVLCSRNVSLVCKGGVIQLADGVQLGMHTTLTSTPDGKMFIGEAVAVAPFCFIGGTTYATDDLNVPISEQGHHHKGGSRFEIGL